jgi:hypothetical protein
VRRRDDSFPALDKRARIVRSGATLTIIGALVSTIAYVSLRVPADINLSIVLLFLGAALLLIGLGRLVEVWLDFHRYRRLLRDAERDSWDPKTEPAEYGPWKPGDP